MIIHLRHSDPLRNGNGTFYGNQNKSTAARRTCNAMDSGLFRAGYYRYGSVVCGHSSVPQ